MTPAPISVERLREVIAFLLGEGELDNRWFGDGSAPLVAGKYRAPYWWRTQLRETTDSLLHQLAEAERAREEATGLLRAASDLEVMADDHALHADGVRRPLLSSKGQPMCAVPKECLDTLRNAIAALAAIGGKDNG